MMICHRCKREFNSNDRMLVSYLSHTVILCPECHVQHDLFMNGCELKPLITDQIRVKLATEKPVDAVLVNGAAWDELKKEYGEEIISGVCTIDGTPVYKTVMETMQDKPCFKLVHGIGQTIYAVE